MASSPTTYTFSPVTDTDRAGLVWVAAILSLMFVILTLATRFQIKFHTLGWDDWLIAAGTVVAIGQYIVIYVGLSEGVGQSSALLSQDYARHLGRMVLASEVIFLLALTLSKLSVVFFMKRLFTPDHKAAWWCCNAALIATCAWGLASPLGVSVGCGPSHILYGPHRCEGKLARWVVVSVVDVLLEFAYVALAFVLVGPLQMRMYIKVTLVFAFAFRLICAVFAALHGVWMAKYIQSPDPGLAIADVLVWQQVALGYSLIATTIPTLRNFIRGYSKAMGWDPSTEKRVIGGGYNLGPLARSHGNSEQLASRRSKGSGGSRPRNAAAEGLRLGPYDGNYQVEAVYDRRRGQAPRKMPSSGSNLSEDPIILRSMSVTVEHERASGANSAAEASWLDV